MTRRLVLTALILFLALPAFAAEKPLRVAVNYFFPPFSWVVGGKTLVGFDVDLANALCAAMGRECKLRAVAPGDRVPGLMLKRFDILATPTSGADPWTDAVALSIPYCRTASVFVAGPGFAGEPTAEALRGRRIGVKHNSPNEAWVKRLTAGGAKIEGHYSMADVLDDLQKGRHDLAFVPMFPAADFLNKWGDKGFRVVGKPIAEDGLGEPLRMAVRKEDKALLVALDAAVAKLLADGTYADLTAKYFPESLRAAIAPAP
ncbi:MAG: transporter substrate-binding domain-containing protein [Magnetospirillum sp. WYHS-4]